MVTYFTYFVGQGQHIFGVPVTHTSQTQMISHNDRLTFELYKSFSTLKFDKAVNGMYLRSLCGNDMSLFIN